MVVQFQEKNLYIVGKEYSRTCELIEFEDNIGIYSVVDELQNIWISIENLDESQNEEIEISFEIKFDENSDWYIMSEILDSGLVIDKKIKFNKNGSYAVTFSTVPSRFTKIIVNSSLGSDSNASITLALTDFDGQ